MRAVFIVCFVVTIWAHFDGVSASVSQGYTGAKCKAGDVWTDEECVRHTCLEDGWESLDSCGIMECDGVSATKQDLSKPYPDCCQKC